jgi:H+/Na+-translocating ferredoxin:NAD+ oxidoreductase subunit A
MGDYILLAISCILINNILLAQYLGNCPFLGTSKKMETAVGMAMAVVFVIVLAGVISWVVYTFFLIPFDLEYLQTLSFILVIASLVQFVEMFLKKSIPALYAGLGIFLPLITTNCAVLGVCLINIKENYTFLQTLVASFSYAVGYGVALILFTVVRERILLARVPRPLQDTSIALVTAGIISLAFFAFKGMV